MEHASRDRFALVLISALIAGCVPSPRGRCGADADCAGGAAGSFCAEGICQGPPRVTLLEVPRDVFGRAATATVRARVERAHGVATARLALGAGSVAGVAEAQGSFRFEVPLSLAAPGVEGAVPISVTAMDDLGHAASAQDVLSVDDRAPRLSIDPVSIPAVAVVRGTVVAVRVTAQDLSAVTVTSPAGPAARQADGSFVIQVDTSRAAAAAALAEIDINGTDAVGNRSTIHASIPITRLRWMASAGSSTIVGLALSDGRVLTTSGSADAYSSQRATGSSVMLNLGRAAIGDLTTDGANIISTRVDNLICRVALDGSTHACCDPLATLRAGPALLGANIIFAASGTSGGGGRLYALTDQSNCNYNATGAPQIDYDFSAPAIGTDGNIYIGGYNSVVVAHFDGIGWDMPNPTAAPARYRGSPALRPPLPTGEQPAIFSRTGGALDSFLFPKDPLHNAPPAPQTFTVAAPTAVLTAPALAEDGTLVVGTQDHTVVALNPDGSQRWSARTSALPSSAPTHGAGGVVYIGEDDGTLLALSILDGSTLWTFPAGAAIRTPPAPGCDRTLYFGTDAGTVFALALDENQNGLANSSWPRTGHDVRGTGDARRPLRSATGACLE
jgi:outer membrane protein assembly factor BamB